MKHPRAGISSTRKKEVGSESHERKSQDEPTIIPEEEPASETHKINIIFCYAALAEKQNGRLYTNATGVLPAMLIDGYQHYFIAYNYDTNYIFAITIEDVTENSIIGAFNQVLTELKEKGLKPTYV